MSDAEQGARKGPGRPRLAPGERREMIVVRVRPDLIVELDRQAKLAGVSRARMVEILVERSRGE